MEENEGENAGTGGGKTESQAASCRNGRNKRGSTYSKEEELFYTEKINLLAGVLAAGLCFTILAWVLPLGQSSSLTEGRFLPRQKHTYRQELLMTPEDGETEEITIEVEPQKLSSEQSRELLARAVEEMESYILGENISLEEVRAPRQGRFWRKRATR